MSTIKLPLLNYQYPVEEFTIKVPVKPHIQKYISNLYGNPVRVSLKNNMGIMVLTMLTSRLESKITRPRRFNSKTGSNEVIFKIPFHYFSISEKHPSLSTRSLINRYFENEFEQELFKYVLDQQLYTGAEIKSAIDIFCANHGIDIETDISFDALKKMHYRYRQQG